MARTRRTTLSGRKPAPSTLKKPPVMEEDDEMQLKPRPKEIVTNSMRSNDNHTYANNNFNENENADDNNDNDNDDDKDSKVEEVEEPQIDLQANHNDKTKSKPYKRSIPQFCKTSISTSSTSQNGLLSGAASLFNGKRVVNKLNLTRVSNKVTTTTNKNVPYEHEKPLDTLSLTETTIAIQKITKDIFPTCRFIAQPSHADSIVWYILHKLGYIGSDHDKERCRRWHAMRKIVIETITKLCNRTLDRYRELAKGKLYVRDTNKFFSLNKQKKISPPIISATILAQGIIPNVDTIIGDEEKFLMTGALTPQLYWFKTKMMRAINNNLWDPFRKSPTGYYVKCGIADEAMGLWILHFKDYMNVTVKSEILMEEKNAETKRTSHIEGKIQKRKRESHSKRLRGHSSMSVNMYTFYKKQLENFRAREGVIPLVNLSDIIARTVINNRNAQQNRPLVVDDGDTSDDDDNEDDAGDNEESAPDPTEYMDQKYWEAV